MRHRKKTIKLGRTTDQREELLAGLVCALIRERRIVTTVSKAKAARSLAEKMVTLGKRGTLASRRQAIAKLRRKDAVGRLFDTIAPAFSDRAGGYTRIVKTGRRSSDSSEMAILEWVDYTPPPKTRKKTEAKKEDADADTKGKGAGKKKEKKKKE
jgi:large subunit ribosomal protein L17